LHSAGHSHHLSQHLPANVGATPTFLMHPYGHSFVQPPAGYGYSQWPMPETQHMQPSSKNPMHFYRPSRPDQQREDQWDGPSRTPASTSTSTLDGALGQTPNRKGNTVCLSYYFHQCKGLSSTSISRAPFQHQPR
jgi:hypothetical protein